MADAQVKVLVLRTAGTNCNEETAFAFAYFGATVEQVHINELIAGRKKLADFHIFALPGGFSYGDDIASGKILANELRLRLGAHLAQFIRDGKLILGICNGFQILVKAGILPGLTPFTGPDFHQEVTLTHNDSARFEARWVYLKPSGKCVWTKGIEDVIYLPVAHGEGKFMVRDEKILEQLKANHQIIFRYGDAQGKKAGFPGNPNGSIEEIAGICDPSGRVFGLMPHPERHFRFDQHPFWSRLEAGKELGDGAKIFENGVNYVKKNLLTKHAQALNV